MALRAGPGGIVAGGGAADSDPPDVAAMVAHSPPGGPGRVLLLYPAETFAAGRVANPGHPLWQFFEAPHLVVHPLVYSKYPPA